MSYLLAEHDSISLLQSMMMMMMMVMKKINETSCNAGASLVPSPVTATTWFSLRNVCTSRSLSFGEDLPITCTTNFIQSTFHWYIGLLKQVTYAITKTEGECMVTYRATWACLLLFPLTEPPFYIGSIYKLWFPLETVSGTTYDSFLC